MISEGLSVDIYVQGRRVGQQKNSLTRGALLTEVTKNSMPLKATTEL